ncbi:MAG: hypothetical protein KC478_14880, partial [Bacteriovoracaceae bacterium]|nr:hypothetical protein [Bacteriovoracaceae bacterium]
NLYVFSAFLNYIAAYMYISLITKRFNYYAKVLNIAKLGILVIGLSIFTIFVMSLNGYQSMFFYFTDIMPNNYFLNQSFAGARLTPLPQIISIIGTTLVLFVNILLLSRFLKDKLKGYQRLVILGVATSIFAKLNDFLISSGHGYYLVPASFLAYFFEILYFQFATIGNDD